MKRWMTLCLGLLATVATGFAAEPQATDDSAGRRAAAEELLTMMHMDKTMEESVNATIEAQVRQNPMLREFKDILRDFLREYLSYDKLKPELVKLYAEAFTTDEIAQLKVFYGTPIGKKLMEKQPQLIRKGTELGERAMQQHSGELRDKILERAKDLAKQRQGPSAPGGVAPPGDEADSNEPDEDEQMPSLDPSTELTIGAAAPPLVVKTWVKGSPMDLDKARGTNICVVEFWATWCGPCRKTIPHLSALARKFKDKGVLFAGISSESEKEVVPFVNNMSTTMEYAVAIDDEEDTTKSYMKGFGVEGIPHAFVIDTSGTVVWHGHPMAGLDEVLEQLVAGTYDLASADKAKKAQHLMALYLAAATIKGEQETLEPLGARVIGLAAKEPMLLNDFSWTILTQKSIKSRDVVLALKAARMANELKKGEAAAILDTLAYALAVNGMKDEAVACETTAIAKAKDDHEKKELTKRLDDIKNGTLGKAK